MNRDSLVNDFAKRCVDEIVANLVDRSGLGNEWDNISLSIKQEILQEWRDIIVAEFNKN
mgnify:CR=1 FL=1